MIISICIPTLNRVPYLKESLDNLFSWDIGKEYFQICISNNDSDDDYSDIECLIEKKRKLGWSIKYVKQESRIDIDRHMHFVVSMANSDYCFLLGDDDFFITEQLYLLVNLVLKNQPDLAIFNANIVDEDSIVTGKHFKLNPTCFNSVEEAFLVLRDKGTFGSILVKRNLLLDEYFEYLYGTSHAYGCYWLTILNKKYYNAKIIIPEFACVNLRMAEKSYNLPVVYYRDIPYEIAVYSRWLTIGTPQKLNHVFSINYYKNINSLGFIIRLIEMNILYKEIFNINPNVAGSILFRIKYIIAKGLLHSKFYYVLRYSVRLYQNFISPAKNQ